MTCCAKREKITCREEKSQPPLDIKWSIPNVSTTSGIAILICFDFFGLNLCHAVNKQRKID